MFIRLRLSLYHVKIVPNAILVADIILLIIGKRAAGLHLDMSWKIIHGVSVVTHRHEAWCVHNIGASLGVGGMCIRLILELIRVEVERVTLILIALVRYTYKVLALDLISISLIVVWCITLYYFNIFP